LFIVLAVTTKYYVANHWLQDLLV